MVKFNSAPSSRRESPPLIDLIDLWQATQLNGVKANKLISLILFKKKFNKAIIDKIEKLKEA